MDQSTASKIRLDIGCGDASTKQEGYIGLDADRGPDDYHPDIVADAYNLPFKDESIDDIWSGACIGVHTNSGSFDEALRVLKPSGKFQVRIYVRDLPRMLHWMLERKLMIENIEPLNYYEYGDSMYGFYEENEYPTTGPDQWFVVLDDVIITTKKRSA